MALNKSIPSTMHPSGWYAFILLCCAISLNAAERPREEISLNGPWEFATDPLGKGITQKWFIPGNGPTNWSRKIVPHTWQVEAGTVDYFGDAWYRMPFGVPEAWQQKRLGIKFQAVSRDADVWINGRKAGAHYGSAYTPFTIPLTSSEVAGRTNILVLRVNNAFSTKALPYGTSYDWAPDGGILRGVSLEATPSNKIHSINIQQKFSENLDKVSLGMDVILDMPSNTVLPRLEITIRDPTGRPVAEASGNIFPSSAANLRTNRLEVTLAEPRLWHFDDPALYVLTCRLFHQDTLTDETTLRFGIKQVLVRPGHFVLNGETVRLMGIEWMPGSHPDHGLAEPITISRKVVEDLKYLNCTFTRFHWQQDNAVLDLMDEMGILVQEEIPVWGKHPLKKPDVERIYQMQAKSMVESHRHHASIFAWGLCNEIKGLSAEGRGFLEMAATLFRKLDHGGDRLVTYASNTLHAKPARDGAGLMDFIEWNEYYGTWYRGGIPNILKDLDEMQKAFPQKGIIISEYGLCECSTNHPSGEASRISMMQEHTAAYRIHPAVAGAIYFSYNDYRTHMGDKGTGAERQRVHGLVDLYGNRKESFESFRAEASPIRQLEVLKPASEHGRNSCSFSLVTRSLQNDFPAYTLRRYVARWESFDNGGNQTGSGEVALPNIAPGSSFAAGISLPAGTLPKAVKVEIRRPNGYPVISTQWKEP